MLCALLKITQWKVCQGRRKKIPLSAEQIRRTSASCQHITKDMLPTVRRHTGHYHSVEPIVFATFQCHRRRISSFSSPSFFPCPLCSLHWFLCSSYRSHFFFLSRFASKLYFVTVQPPVSYFFHLRITHTHTLSWCCCRTQGTVSDGRRLFPANGRLTAHFLLLPWSFSPLSLTPFSARAHQQARHGVSIWWSIAAAWSPSIASHRTARPIALTSFLPFLFPFLLNDSHWSVHYWWR